MLYPQGKDSGAHWRGGWVGSRAGLDAAVKREIPVPAGNGTPIVHTVA